jgi:hypothetical protein
MEQKRHDIGGIELSRGWLNLDESDRLGEPVIFSYSTAVWNGA